MNLRFGSFAGLCTFYLLFVAFTPALLAQQLQSGQWVETAGWKNINATQAAAADDKHVYGISNTKVVKYDRITQAVVSESTGSATHLNSGIFIDGQLYCAHSNYPAQPEQSQIMVLDPLKMELKTFHSFGASEGSLTWAIKHNEHWYCNFAYYDQQNDRSYLAKFDRDWKELQRWKYPAELLKKLGQHSLSGGIKQQQELLVTGHDDPIIFRLQFPDDKQSELKLLGEQRAPLTGQGFAFDPVTNGLIGIHRPRREILFLEWKSSGR